MTPGLRDVIVCAPGSLCPVRGGLARCRFSSDGTRDAGLRTRRTPVPRSSSRFRPLVLLALVALLFSAVASPVAAAKPAKSPSIGSAQRTVMFASDGMRPDLMEKYAKAGAMPTYKELMKDGVTGDNGMLQAFPPNTGVGWYTMATGTYPSEHGSTNNTYFRAGDAFSNRTSFSAAGSAPGGHDRERRRAGRQEGRPDRLGRRRRREHRRPDRRLHELLLQPRRARRRGRSGRAGRLGVLRRQLRGRDARSGVGLDRRPGRRPGGDAEGDDLDDPRRRSPLRTRTAPTTSTSTTASPAAASTYDHAIVSPVGKTGAAPSIDLKVGDFLPHQADGRQRPDRHPRQPDGRPLREADLARRRRAASSSSTDTSLARAIAKCGTVVRRPAGRRRRRGPAREVHRRQPACRGRQATSRRWRRASSTRTPTSSRAATSSGPTASQVINYILGTLQPDTDLAMVGYPFTDEVSHQFMGLVVADRRRRRPEPVLRRQPEVRRRPVHRPRDGRTRRRSARATSAAPTRTPTRSSAIARELMGGNPTTFAGSDHGFAPQCYAVNANAVLNAATVGGVSLHASNAERRPTAAPSAASPVAPPTAPVRRPTTSRRPAGPAARSRSTSTRTGSGASAQPTRRSRPTRRCGRPSATRSRA